jgi:hypothetical protein
MKNKIMYLFVLAVFIFCFQVSYAQNVAVNSTGTSADGSAMLDVSSTSKGLLIPRVSLTSTSDGTTISSPAASLIVYNTNGAITGTDADSTGYYFNAGTSGAPKWVKMVEQGAPRWDDLRVVLDNGADGTDMGYLSGTSGPQIWYFRNNGTIEAMSFTVQLPHSWKEGTTIYPHLHWTPKDATTGNVEWNFEYTWANYDPTTLQFFGAHTTSTIIATVAANSTNSHMITALTASNAGISGTGKKISSILICKIWRNSNNTNDTYQADAGGLFVDFHVQIDGWGSRGTFTK